MPVAQWDTYRLCNHCQQPIRSERGEQRADGEWYHPDCPGGRL